MSQDQRLLASAVEYIARQNEEFDEGNGWRDHGEAGEFLRVYHLVQEAKARRDITPPEALDFCTQSMIWPMQIRSEIQRLVELVADRQPTRVLEIGTANGGTLFLWCLFADRDATIVSIDLPGGGFGGGYPRKRIPLYRSFARPTQALHLLRENSHNFNTFEKVKALFPEGVDFLLIDGDHAYDGVKSDFEMYGPLVEHGLIVFHDIAPHSNKDCHVDKFWTQICGGNYREIIAPGYEWGGIGVIER